MALLPAKCGERGLTLAIVLCAIASVTACCACSDDGGHGGPRSARQLLAAAKPLIERAGVAGVALSVIRNGQSDSATVGWADRETRTPMQRGTIHQVASLSKSVTAWGVLSLVERGALELDAPFTRYLPGLRLPDAEFEWDDVTVGALLSHTGGLSLPLARGVSGSVTPPLEQTLWPRGAPHAETLRLVAAPGTRFMYSGGGYALLQLIVERVSHLPFATFMERAVLGPLGMSDSSFAPAAADHPLHAAGYDHDGRRVVPLAFAATAAAGLHSTIDDMARFVAANAPGPAGEPPGRGVLAPRTLQVMFSSVPGSRHRVPGTLSLHQEFGLGYALSSSRAGVRFIEHTGTNPGWTSRFNALPSRGEAIVILANSTRTGRLMSALTCAWSEGLDGVALPYCAQLDRVREIVDISCALVLAALFVFACVAVRARYRRRPRGWTWSLLAIVPAGFACAIGAAMLDRLPYGSLGMIANLPESALLRLLISLTLLSAATVLFACYRRRPLDVLEGSASPVLTSQKRSERTP